MKHHRLVLWLIALLHGLGANLPAAEFIARWIGEANGNWTDPANWDIGQVPNNTGSDTYDVIWDRHPVTVTLTQDIVIRDFHFLSGGTLAGSSQRSFTIQRAFRWTQGVLAVRGETTVEVSAMLDGVTANSLKLDGGVLRFKRSTDLRSTVEWITDGRIVNDVAGIFRASDGSGFRRNTSNNSFPRIVNLGAFDVPSGAKSFPCVRLDNQGTMDVGARTIEFNTGDVFDLTQTSRTLYLRGATLNGKVLIEAGAGLDGNGYLREATILGELNVRGRLTFGQMALGLAARSVFHLNGSADGSFGHITVDRGLVPLAGTIELDLFDWTPMDSDVLEILTAPGGIFGEFSNVKFGQSISASSFPGEICYLDRRTDFKSVILRNFERPKEVEPPDPANICALSFVHLIHLILNPAGPQSRAGGNDKPAISLATFYALQSLLNQTVDGRRLAALYWLHTEEVVRLLRADPDLVDQAIAVVRGFQPGVSALLSGNGNAAPITQLMIDHLNILWSGLANAASPGLRTALMQEQARFIGFQQFVNKDFSQWASLLKVPAPAQPWVHISRLTKSGDRVSLEINDVPGLDFSLWRSSSLTTWEPVPNAVILRSDFTLRLADPAAPPEKAFYEIRP